MPKLWTDTIEAHREAVAEAIFAATARIIAQGGFAALSMARIAQEAGIGRATLYKYFSDLEQLLAAWHEQVIGEHLRMLEGVAAGHSDPRQALEAILTAFAEIRRTDHGHLPAGMLHSLPHVYQAQDHLRSLLRKHIAAAARQGTVRADVPADDLAGFALAALEQPRGGAGKSAVRLVLRAMDP